MSPRKKEILDLICEGLTTPEIASRLFISENTVKVHRKEMMIKFNARTLPHLVALWLNFQKTA